MTDDLVARLLDWPYQGETMAHEAADSIKQLVATNKQLTAERDRLREALTFYAAPETYQDIFVAEDCECCHRREHPAIEDDNGKVARAALKGESYE